MVCHSGRPYAVLAPTSGRREPEPEKAPKPKDQKGLQWPLSTSQASSPT